MEALGRSGKNLLVLSGSEIAVRLLTLATLVLIARYFDPQAFGRYNVYLAYYAIAAVLANFGFDRLTIRELATGGGESAKKFGTLFWLRSGAGVLGAVVLLVVGSVLEGRGQPFFLLFSLALIPGAPAGAYTASYHARQNFTPPAAAAAAGALTGLALAGAGVVLRTGFAFFVFAFFLSEVVRAAYLMLAARRESWGEKYGFDAKWARTAIVAAFPYALLALLGMVYFRIDIFMLDRIIGGAEVGHYAAAFRILDAG
ncbi:MAG: oligosaccharide flippase family protein, partial [Longimicrobiales bacterium]